jgi:putative flavoprotein involved in K+ transport
MASYLEAYATRFALPVRNGVEVDRLSRQNNRYLVTAGDRQFEAEHVVVAMANYQQPRVPELALDLDPNIVQLHSRDYRSPSQLRDGDVLLVGAGNSGAEIALEVARAGHRTSMSGRDTGSVPFRLGGFLGRLGLTRFMLRFVFHRVLTLKTPMGRKVRAKILHHGGPLIRVKSADLAAVHVERLPKMTGVRDGRPVLTDGRVLDVANVIWCTGFTPSCSWIDLPIFAKDGEPIHQRGQVTNEPGLYFVGRHFLYAMSSTMIHGVGRDAEHIVDVIAARVAEARRMSVVTSTRTAMVRDAAAVGR